MKANQPENDDDDDDENVDTYVDFPQIGKDLDTKIQKLTLLQESLHETSNTIIKF